MESLMKVPSDRVFWKRSLVFVGIGKNGSNIAQGLVLFFVTFHISYQYGECGLVATTQS